VGLAIYAGYSLLWSSLYYADSFAERAGIDVQPVSAQELYDTAVYYADLANAAADTAPRDGSGVFDASVQDIFAAAPVVYENTVDIFPILAGRDLRPKPMVFSRLMSEINFTGFFFPFTGEANLNIDAPRAYLPATICHELSHQRGVAAEDEANFLAVVVGTNSGNDMYVYSSALFGYTELSNALYGADQDLYYKVADTLNASVVADMNANGAYWAQFETKAAAVSTAVYGNFLQSNGQTLGMQSYGACVDLLVAWYEAGNRVGS